MLKQRVHLLPLREGPYLIDFYLFYGTQHSTLYIHSYLVNKCSFIEKKINQSRTHLTLFLSPWETKISGTKTVVPNFLLTLLIKLWRRKKKKKLPCCRHYWCLSIFCFLLLQGMGTITLPHLLEDAASWRKIWQALANDMEGEMPCATPRPKHLIPAIFPLL